LLPDDVELVITPVGVVMEEHLTERLSASPELEGFGDSGVPPTPFLWDVSGQELSVGD